VSENPFYEAGTVLAGGAFRIQKLHAVGGMGAVYKARSGTQTVAIKAPFSTTRKRADYIANRLRREIAILGSVRDPAVVQLNHNFDENGWPHMVMPFLRGRPLGKWLDQPDSYTPTGLVSWGLRIAGGLYACHRAGIVHRDIKPDNIFLERSLGDQLHPVVIDFSIAKKDDLAEVDESPEELDALTTHGQVMGTPQYMAPEQALGRNTDVGPAADQFALAAILYHGLSGRRPYPASAYQNLTRLSDMMSEQKPTPLDEYVPDLPAGLVATIMRGLSVETSERYPNIYAFAKDLAPYASEETRVMWLASYTYGGAEPPVAQGPADSFLSLPLYTLREGSIATDDRPRVLQELKGPDVSAALARAKSVADPGSADASATVTSQTPTRVAAYPTAETAVLEDTSPPVPPANPPSIEVALGTADVLQTLDSDTGDSTAGVDDTIADFGPLDHLFDAAGDTGLSDAETNLVLPTARSPVEAPAPVVRTPDAAPEVSSAPTPITDPPTPLWLRLRAQPAGLVGGSAAAVVVAAVLGLSLFGGGSTTTDSPVVLPDLRPTAEERSAAVPHTTDHEEPAHNADQADPSPASPQPEQALVRETPSPSPPTAARHEAKQVAEAVGIVSPAGGVTEPPPPGKAEPPQRTEVPVVTAPTRVAEADASAAQKKAQARARRQRRAAERRAKARKAKARKPRTPYLQDGTPFLR